MTGALVNMGGELPLLLAFFAPTPDVAWRYVEFFTSNIRNPRTRRVYARVASEFAAWCRFRGIILPDSAEEAESGEQPRVRTPESVMTLDARLPG